MDNIETEEQHLQRLRSAISQIPKTTEYITITAVTFILVGFFFAVYNGIVSQQSITELDKRVTGVQKQYDEVQNELRRKQSATDASSVQLEQLRRQYAEVENRFAQLQSRYDELVSRTRAQLATAGGFINSTGGVGWRETGVQADWGGRDIASTSGITPRFSIGNLVLCDQNKIGSIAVCWQNRRGGFPPGVPSDVQGSTQTWCTYKNDTIRENTPPDGSAPPGIVFVCSSVAR
jgi:hypothetical protein